LLEIVAEGLRAHGEGRVVLPPKAHLFLPERYAGHFNILPGYVEGGTRDAVGLAGVKVVGDFVENWRERLPSEVAMLTLYDPRTGVPRGILDATVTTWLRTGAVTGIGARHLANPESRVVAHLGARGTAFHNIAALRESFALDEIRIVSRRPESADRLVARVQAELGLALTAPRAPRRPSRGPTSSSRRPGLEAPEILIPDRAVKPGALLVT